MLRLPYSSRSALWVAQLNGLVDKGAPRQLRCTELFPLPSSASERESLDSNPVPISKLAGFSPPTTRSVRQCHSNSRGLKVGETR